MKAKGIAIPAGAGDAFWFLGTLMTVKVDGTATRGGFTLIEQVAPAGFQTPPHTHKTEEEVFYLLEGRLHVTCGDDSWSVGPGGVVLLPRGVPHSFAVADDGQARLLQITSPAQFERFLAEAGDKAPRHELPPQANPDIPRMLAAAAKYGYEVLAGPAA